MNNIGSAFGVAGLAILIAFGVMMIIGLNSATESVQDHRDNSTSQYNEVSHVLENLQAN